MFQWKKRPPQEGGRSVSAVLHSKTLLSVLMLTVAFLIVYGVFLIVATPQRHDLEVGDIAPTTITATKDIEDTAATEQLREQAAASIVEGATRLDTTISATVDENVVSILTVMTQARTDYAAVTATVAPTATPEATESETAEPSAAAGGAAESAGASSASAEATPTASPAATPVATAPRESATQRQQAVQEDLNAQLTGFGVELTNAQLRAVLTASESTFDGMCDVILTLTREAMETGIREGQLDERLQALHLQILGRGDAYTGEGALPRQEARAFHRWQAEAFRRAGADFLLAGILPTAPEAQGMAQAMAETGLPYVLSLTLRRDGRLVDGTRLCDLIRETDALLGEGRPAFYMSNGIHPDAVRAALDQAFNRCGAVRARFLGVQANTSPRSFAELDGAEALQGDAPEPWAEAMLRLHRAHPMRLLGGCCGTDGRHMAALAARLTAEAGN